MKPIRFYFALLAAKAALLGLKILGRSATYLPGKVAVRLCPDFLAHLTPPKTVIAVTGTNGKTTVSNLVTSVLRKCGYTVTNNSTGTNVQAGIATALLADATLTGKPTRDVAVLEVDERSSLRIYPDLKPDWLLCNNLMQDSVKRNAHTEFIRYIMDRAIPPSTRLILNGDDLICADLAPGCQTRTYFGLEADIPPEGSVRPSVQSLVYCPDCGGPLQAEYLRYNHIGRMYCPGCGKRSPAPDYRVTSIDRTQGTFTLCHGEETAVYPLVNDNVVNIYNVCGVIALLSQMGLGEAQIRQGLADTQVVKTRQQSLEVAGRKITMLLAKGQNPIACTRCFSYTAGCPGEDKRVIIMVDDKFDNVNNSENICWLYDCDYSYLADPSISRIVFAGPRHLDHFLRAQLAGVPADKLRTTADYRQIPDLLGLEDAENIYLLFELYLDKKAEEVADALAEALRKEEVAK